MATETSNDTDNKNITKCARYYYRHREELLEKSRQKRMADPEYAARMAAKEAKRQADAEAKRIAQEQKEAVKQQREAIRAAKEEAKEERRRLRAIAVGLNPPGVEKTCIT